MTIKYLNAYGWEDTWKVVDEVKKASGISCTDVWEIPIVETATGKEVLKAFEVTFEGGFFQWLKALKVLKSIHQDRTE